MFTTVSYSFFRLSSSTVYITSNESESHSWVVSMDLENGFGCLKALSLEWAVETEENCEQPESRYPLDLSRFRPNIPSLHSTALSAHKPARRKTSKHYLWACSSTAETVISTTVLLLLVPLYYSYMCWILNDTTWVSVNPMHNTWT